MTLTDWLEKNVTQDPRALEWFGRGAQRDDARAEHCEARIVRAYRELLSGYSIDPATILKTTRRVAPEETPGVVTVVGISFTSICAHHFLPFFGKVKVSYLPGDRILGLGKLPRLVQAYARRFQIQEDLVKEIAEELMRSGGARAARASCKARHLCICARGPSDPTSYTRTEYQAGTWP
ncbi:MAG: GTP cyclohydrolase I [Deltaproteobacteria bacterium]|nr:GTP cyclohydrolase I [Deltaproteobacteria bacterium]